MTIIGAAFGGMRSFRIRGWDVGYVVPDSSSLVEETVEVTEGVDSLYVWADACQLRLVEGSEFRVDAIYDIERWELNVVHDRNRLDVGLRVNEPVNLGIDYLRPDAVVETELVITYPRGHQFKVVEVTGNAVQIEASGRIVSQSVKLDLNAADVAINHMECKDLDLTIAAGSVRIDGLKVSKTMTIKLDAGKVDVSDAEVKDMSLKMAAGSFTFEGELSGNNTVKLAAGDIDLALRQPESDLAITYKVDAGEITINGKAHGGLSSSGSAGSVGGKVKLDITLEFGSVQIHTE
jgi:hypothetical protein